MASNNFLTSQNELLLHIFQALASPDGASLSACSRAFCDLVRRSPNLVAVKLLTVQEMRKEDGQEDEEWDEFYSAWGHKGEGQYEGVHRLRARICLGGQSTSAKMVLLKRRQHMHYNFHLACDAESDDLLRVGTGFCDAIGCPHLASVRACGPEVKTGGFLFIEWIDVKSEQDEGLDLFEQPNFMAMTVRKLLQQTALAGRWSLAVALPREPHEIPGFIQAGFVQAPELAWSEDLIALFASPSFLRSEIKSWEAAVSVPITYAPDTDDEAAEPSGIDADLHKLVASAAPEAEILKLIKEGASIEASCALHWCAANHACKQLEMLLRLTSSPEAAVNQPDRRGLTPLMLAAEAVSERFAPAKLSLDVFDQLLQSGADLSATDLTGLSVLGHFRQALRDINHDKLYYGHSSASIFADKAAVLETLLTPPRGPTAADNYMKDWPEFDEDLSSDNSLEEGEEEENSDGDDP